MMTQQRPGFVKGKDLEERIYNIKRVSKKTSGGNTIGFTALVLVGDRHGKIGAGLGKAKDVSRAIQKALESAKTNLVEVFLKGDTVPYELNHKYAAARVLLKPAPKGSGVIAGGAVRVVLELAGVKDVSAKMYGSNNKLANVRCTIEALGKFKRQ